MLSNKLLKGMEEVINEKNLFVPNHLGGQQSQMDIKQIYNLWEKFLKENKNNKIILNNIQLYIHIPFCFQTICKYCMYGTNVIKGDKDKKLINYLKELKNALIFFLLSLKMLNFVAYT